MRRMPSIARLVWSTVAVSAGCGRLGFDAPADGAGDIPVANVAPSLGVNVVCGATPDVAAVAIANRGGVELRVTDATADGGFSVVSTLPLVIAPGAVAMLEVRPPAAVIGTDRDGAERSGTLVLTTNEPTSPRHSVALVAKFEGADLDVVDLGNQPLAALMFSAGSGLCPTSEVARVRNLGSQAAQVRFEPTPAFATSGSSTIAIDPSSTASVSIRPLTSGPCSGTGSIVVATLGPVCSVTPSVLQASFTITGAGTCACS